MLTVRENGRRVLAALIACVALLGLGFGVGAATSGGTVEQVPAQTLHALSVARASTARAQRQDTAAQEQAAIARRRATTVGHKLSSARRAARTWRTRAAIWKRRALAGGKRPRPDRHGHR